MSTSAYFSDVQPQYRDAGCPSQCMGMNEYTTIPDMYSFSTSPDTPLLTAGDRQGMGILAVQNGAAQTTTTNNVTPMSENTMAPMNVPSTFQYVDPNMNYKENYGATMRNGTAPSGLVYPVSGSIKNHRVARYADPLLASARLPADLNAPKTMFGYSYPVVKQGYAMNKEQAPGSPVVLKVNRQ